MKIGWQFYKDGDLLYVPAASRIPTLKLGQALLHNVQKKTDGKKTLMPVYPSIGLYIPESY